ncbi:hypothetical protein HDU76_007580 [Blyttiomyces sp. JEL0837]|nr:hypothetical protein HDU76_007580 [Blyttiomyces sp. JEL0837]
MLITLEKLQKLARKKLIVKRDENAGDPLPPFYPKPAVDRLPNVAGIPPNAIDLPNDPNGHYAGRQLLRAIDLDHRQRHDFDNRTELFRKGSPDAIEPGSVVLIEQASSRSSPRKLTFAGVLIAINRKGIMSSITVRNYVMGTGVEMVFPIYSPMVTKIKVLKSVKGFAKGEDQIFRIRDRPSLAPLSYKTIDDMVMKDAEIERKREANRKI